MKIKKLLDYEVYMKLQKPPFQCRRSTSSEVIVDLEDAMQRVVVVNLLNFFYYILTSLVKVYD